MYILYTTYMLDVRSKMSCPKTGATHYHAQLNKSSRQRSLNQRVDCLLCSMAIIYEMGLWTNARCVVVPCCGQDGYRATATPDI